MLYRFKAERTCVLRVDAAVTGHRWLAADIVLLHGADKTRRNVIIKY